MFILLGTLLKCPYILSNHIHDFAPQKVSSNQMELNIEFLHQVVQSSHTNIMVTNQQPLQFQAVYIFPEIIIEIYLR